MEKVLQNTSSYIHIPFCEHICFYCNFNKVFLKGQPVDEYIQGLLKEIQLTLDLHPTDASQTIYIGGGTPTCLSAKQLDDLLSGITQLLPVETTKEFTIEANPGDLTQEKLNVIKNYGINRLSMGVQTFDNRLLRRIGRKHTAVPNIKINRKKSDRQPFNRFNLCSACTKHCRFSYYFRKSDRS